MEAVKDLDVKVALQPSTEGHKMFTDFLFRLYTDEKPVCFIEVKTLLVPLIHLLL